jgi:hypothetical protein
MAKERRHIDSSGIPALLTLVQEVRQTNEPMIVREDREDVALLMPMKPVGKPKVRGKPVTADDPLWKLVGIGHSGKGDVSANKHTYLARAYRPR